jgi:hypothetical protein
MRQTADILSSKAAMQIRYLETMKNIANSQGIKIVLIWRRGKLLISATSQTKFDYFTTLTIIS